MGYQIPPLTKLRGDETPEERRRLYEMHKRELEMIQSRQKGSFVMAIMTVLAVLGITAVLALAFSHSLADLQSRLSR